MKLFFFFFLVLLLSPVALAATHKQAQEVLISHAVRLNDYPSPTIKCNITIEDPDNNIIVFFKPMVNNATIERHQYLLAGGNTTTCGEYCYDVTCQGSGINSTNSFCFDVTPSGTTQTSILNNPLLIIFGLLGIGLLILGIYTENAYLGFISGALFFVVGVYTMIYGFNDTTDLYTRVVANTFIGLGLLFTLASAYEWIHEEEHNENF